MKILKLGFLLVLTLLPRFGFASPLVLTEDKVIELALQMSLTIQMAHLDNDLAKTDIQKSKSIFDTTFTGSGSHLIDKQDQSSTIFGTNNNSTSFGLGVERPFPSGTRLSINWDNVRQSSNSLFSTVNPYYESSLSLSVRQPLLKNSFGLMDRSTVLSANKTYESASAQIKRQISEVLYGILENYWEWVAQHDDVEIVRLSVNEALEFEKIAAQKVYLGLFESTDLLAAKSSRLELEREFDYSQWVREQSLLHLEEALNLNEDIVLTAHEKFPFEDKIQNRDAILKEALKNRPDYLSAHLEVEQKLVEISMAQNNKWPQLDLVASFGLNGIHGSYDSSLSETIQADHPQFSIGGELEWPLENREGKSMVNKALLGKKKALLNLKRVENQIVREVDEALKEVQLRSREVKTSREIERLNREKWEKELAEYRKGRSKSEKVLISHEDYLQSRRMTLKALFKSRLASLSLRLATHSLIPGALE